MQDQLTFGLIMPKTSTPFWHRDFAISFATYFKTKFKAEFIMGLTIDQILEACKTKYLVLQNASHVIHNPKFIDELSKLENNIVVGYVKKTDYARLDDSCLFFNIELWKKAGKPKYKGEQKVGLGFTVVEDGLERSGENALIKSEDAMYGANLIDEQLKLHGRFFEFPKSADEHSFLFEHSTPYHEIHYETLFEDTILANRLRVVTHESEEMPDIPDGKADVLVTHASGLTPLLLAEHYNVSKVYVIDTSQPALDFQKLLFSVEQSVLYGDVVSTFTEENPNAVLCGDFENDEYAVVSPLNIEVHYMKVDVVGQGLERFIKEELDIESSVVVNFGDIFLLPLNYYKRKKAHGMGMFREVWSLLASRTGPTRLIGCDAEGVWYNGDIINGDTERFTE